MGVYLAIPPALFIGQQIQLYTSWSESRQHKFSDIGNSKFLLEEYSTAG